MMMHREPKKVEPYVDNVNRAYCLALEQYWREHPETLPVRYTPAYKKMRGKYYERVVERFLGGPVREEENGLDTGVQ